MIKTELRRHFSHVPTTTHANVQLLERRQLPTESLREYVYNFSLLALSATNRIPSQITDATKIIVFIRGLYNVAIRSKVGRRAHRNLQSCMDFAYKVDNDLLLLEGYNNTDTKILAVQTRAQAKKNISKTQPRDNDQRPDPKKNHTCYQCGDKGHYSYECPHRTNNKKDQYGSNDSNAPMMVTQTLQAEYSIPTYKWANILKELYKSKVMRYHQNIQQRKPSAAGNSKNNATTNAATNPVMQQPKSSNATGMKVIPGNKGKTNIPKTEKVSIIGQCPETDFLEIDVEDLEQGNFNDEMINAILMFDPDNFPDSDEDQVDYE